jgi:hypothetical protein
LRESWSFYSWTRGFTDRLYSYFAKNEDAASALDLKKALIQYDRTLLVADPRRMEPKKVRRCRKQKFDWALIFFCSSSEEREPDQGGRKVIGRAIWYGMVYTVIPFAWLCAFSGAVW